MNADSTPTIEASEVVEFREVQYTNGKIFFDKRHDFHKHFGHWRRTRRFPFYENVLRFTAANPDVHICFTLDESIKPFRKIRQGYIVNVDSYIAFCKAISRSTQGRIHAFLSQNLNLRDISATQADKDEYIKVNATKTNILAAIEGLHPDIQIGISDSLKKLRMSSASTPPQGHEISVPEFLNAFSRLLTDRDVQAAFIQNIPQVQIQILKSHIQFLRANLAQSEMFIQNWIDAEDGKYRKQRCLIFGVEYIDPKREGKLSGKRFDVLAEQNRNHHVIIELKSPSANVFDIVSRPNPNGGQVEDYSISKELSRAVPQILGYKRWYEQASPEEIQELGLTGKKKISRCIIVIGQDKDSPVWKENLNNLRNTLVGVEICTYTDLINKLENTVQNLEETLRQPNHAPEPTAATHSVSDVRGNPKVGDSSASVSGGAVAEVSKRAETQQQ